MLRTEERVGQRSGLVVNVLYYTAELHRWPFRIVQFSPVLVFYGGKKAQKTQTIEQKCFCLLE